VGSNCTKELMCTIIQALKKFIAGHVGKIVSGHSLRVNGMKSNIKCNTIKKTGPAKAGPPFQKKHNPKKNRFMKWFKNIETLEELRKMYRKLAMENHPDKGGQVKDMQEINNEYEHLSKNLINGNANFSEGRKFYEHEISKNMKVKIDEILNLTGIDIEIMGSWIWVTGNTRPNKEELKTAGFKFSGNKIAWYWHGDEYFKRNGKTMSLEDIRKLFGSEEINKKNQKPKNPFLGV
jgi:hypothetical protein